jgi:hypothetical protein
MCGRHRLCGKDHVDSRLIRMGFDMTIEQPVQLPEHLLIVLFLSALVGACIANIVELIGATETEGMMILCAVGIVVAHLGAILVTT